jgi:V/A-type H+-transporting ATPase subunit A
VGRIIREDFLQQNAYHEIDAYCSMRKAYGIMKMILTLYKEAEAAIRRGVSIDEILALPVVERIGRARYVSEEEFPRYFEEAMREIEGAFKALA